MFKTYLKIAFRNLWKYPIFSAINILGLAIAMSAAMVVYLLVDYDFSFDKFHKDGDRIYRVIYQKPANGLISATSSTSLPYLFGETIKKEIPAVESVNSVVIYQGVNSSIPKQGKQEPSVFSYKNGVVLVSPDYFELINYQWLIGSPAVLNTAYQVVLTEKQAKEYFPKLKLSEIAGREVIYNDTLRTTVGGIVANLKENTDFAFSDFIAQATISVSPKLSENFYWNFLSCCGSYNNVLIKLNKSASYNRKNETS